MKERMTSKEFSRYFSRHKGKELLVTSNGEVVGRWVPEVRSDQIKPKSDVNEAGSSGIGVSPEEFMASVGGSDRVHEEVGPTFVEGPLCEECGVNVAEKVQWVDGEDIQLCKSGVKGKYYQGAPKFFEKAFKKMQSI